MEQSRSNNQNPEAGLKSRQGMMMKNRIERVWIERAVDSEPDTSWLGEYSSVEGPGAIDRKARGEMGRNEHRWFVPARAASAEADYRRMESLNAGDWHFVGVIAKALIVSANGVCQTLRSGGLWGVESDSEAEYLASVEAEELAALRAELEALALGFGKRAVAYAFGNVERE